MAETLIQPPELATAHEVAETLPPSEDAGFDFSKLEEQATEKDGMSPAATNPKSQEFKARAAKAEAARVPDNKPDTLKPDAKTAPEAAKVEAKPAAATAAPEAAKPAVVENPDKPKSLGQLFRDEQKQTKELRAKAEGLENRLKELESKPHTPADDPEKKKLTARLEELESEIRFVNYEKSGEFRDKYHQPYLKKSQELTKEAGELVVDRPDGTYSAMSTQEFWDVVTSPTLNDAVKAARELFPDDPTKANQVLGMRKEIKASWDTMQQAKEEYRTKGAEREKQTQLQEQQKRAQEEAQSALEKDEDEKDWMRQSETALKRAELKDIFQVDESDSKGKELWTKGFNDVDFAFGKGPKDANGKHLNSDGAVATKADFIYAYSVLRNKAGAMNYVAYKYRTEKARTAELEKELAQYRGSQPTPGAPKGDKAPNAEGGSLEDRLESFVGG